MKNLLFTGLFLFLGTFLIAQSAVGTWKTVDDESGEAKSYIQIYEKDGELYGKVIEILSDKKDAVCSSCKGKNKNKPIVGMVVLEGVEKDGKNKWDDGKILDPNNGKTYDVSLELVEKNKLKVRGYIGFSMLGRTQYWYRK
ncbi:DUF2147 domain-containing protein [Flavobacteriaceae bacterium Ap0902]|nr:DUF2147 domain-containing protein [Flavobacteriaceae bacterium Ap0902]